MASETLKVEVQKDFKVTVEQLYKAWNEPDQLKQWWKPLDNTLQEVQNDLKQGGKIQYVFNDETIVISGEYEEVKPNEKLVYSWNWRLKEDALRNADYKLTVEFKAADEGSSIHVTQENFESEEATQPHREGWDKGLSDLKNYLEGSSSTTGSENEGGSPADATAGYGESPEQQKVGGG